MVVFIISDIQKNAYTNKNKMTKNPSFLTSYLFLFFIEYISIVIEVNTNNNKTFYNNIKNKGRLYYNVSKMFCLSQKKHIKSEKNYSFIINIKYLRIFSIAKICPYFPH